jgi:hypothetical protein
VRDGVISHMIGLCATSEYFPSETEKYDLICSPFNNTTSDLCSKDMEHCIELICNQDLKLKYFSDRLIKFWVRVQHYFVDTAK